MIVLDASVIVDLLTNGPVADSLRRDLSERTDVLIVPHLLDVEVASALRKLVVGQRVDAHHAGQIPRAASALPAQRYSHTPLLRRIWELRHKFTCYDAAYIALAEAIEATLYTSDVKLSSGHGANVRVFA